VISLRDPALHGPWDSFAGRSWSASVLAVALTGAAIAALVTATSRALPDDWRLPSTEAAATTERVTYVTPPVALPPPAALPPRTIDRAPAGVPAARLPAMPPAVAPAPVAPPQPAADSTRGGARPGLRLDPSATPIPLAPLPGSQPATACAAPCMAGARAGFAERSNLSREAMDSVLKLMAAAAVIHAKVRPSGTHVIPAPQANDGRPRIGIGIELESGLPGGGPSAKQRARDRKLYAQNLESLARIKARADSVLLARRDSLRRAIAARLDSTRRAAKPDSTGR
jgi:hypothetical protein